MFSEHTRTVSRTRILSATALVAMLGFGNLHCSDADEHPDPAPAAGRSSVPPSGTVSTPGPDGPSGGRSASSPPAPTEPGDGRGGAGGTGATGLSPTVGGNLGLGGAGIGTAGASFGVGGASSGDPNLGAFAGSGPFGSGNQGTGGARL